MDNERRGEGDGAPVWMTVREEMLPVVVADIVVVVSWRVVSCRRIVDVVVVVEGGGRRGRRGEKEGEDVHRRTFAESDEKQQSSEIIDFVRRGTRRNGRW